LVLSDSITSVAIIDVDAIGFDAPMTKRILEAVMELTKLPRDNIRLSCTHTHSGANTFRLANIAEGRDLILQYLESLPGKIAGAAWQAQQNMRPVRYETASGVCTIGVNRRYRTPDGDMVVGRNWSGPVDKTVRVIRFDDLNEQPFATIVHYSCHPTTMAWQCQYFTPDYPGMMRRTVEEQLGGTCLFLQGAAGDVHTHRGHSGDLSIYRHWGKVLGLEAAKTALSIETLPRRERWRGIIQSGAVIALFDDEPQEPKSPRLKVGLRRMRLPLKQFRAPDQLENELRIFRREADQARLEANQETLRVANARATQMSMQVDNARLYHGETYTDWELQGIGIGDDVALLSIPGEPFVEIGIEVAARSPFRQTLFSGYSNGGFGYIPVRSAYERGGYEVDVTPFSPSAAEVVVEESLSMLQFLRSEPSVRTAG
jgi:hypothetical protein